MLFKALKAVLAQTLAGKKQRPVFFAFVRESIRKTGTQGEQLFPPTEVIADAVDPSGEDKGIVAFLRDDRYTIREITTGTPDEASMTWMAAVALGAKPEESTRLDPRWLNYAGPPPDPPDPPDPHHPNATITTDAQHTQKNELSNR